MLTHVYISMFFCKFIIFMEFIALNHRNFHLSYMDIYECIILQNFYEAMEK
jgi:hypothetical protein